MEFRCVKCSENHGPNNCKLGSNGENTDILKCANCNGNHVASYRNCPIFKERLKSRTKSQPTIISHRINSESNYMNPNITANTVNNTISFAQAIKNSKAIPQVITNTQNIGNANNTDNALNFLNNESINFFDLNMFEILDKAKNFLPNYLNLNTDIEKKQVCLILC